MDEPNPYKSPKAIATDGSPESSPVVVGSDDTISIAYEVTLEDVVAAAVRLHRLSWRRWGAVSSVALLVLGPLAAFLIQAIKRDPEFSVPSSVVFVEIFLAAFLVFLSPWVQRRLLRRSRRLLVRQNPAEFFGPLRLSVGPTGINTMRRTGNVTRHWDSLDKIEITDTHAFIFCAKLILYFVPRRAFSGEGDFNRFVSLVNHYIKAAACNCPAGEGT